MPGLALASKPTPPDQTRHHHRGMTRMGRAPAASVPPRSPNWQATSKTAGTRPPPPTARQTASRPTATGPACVTTPATSALTAPRNPSHSPTDRSAASQTTDTTTRTSVAVQLRLHAFPYIGSHPLDSFQPSRILNRLSELERALPMSSYRRVIFASVSAVLAADDDLQAAREHGMHALRHFYASVLLDAGRASRRSPPASGTPTPASLSGRTRT